MHSIINIWPLDQKAINHQEMSLLHRLDIYPIN